MTEFAVGWGEEPYSKSGLLHCSQVPYHWTTPTTMNHLSSMHCHPLSSVEPLLPLLRIIVYPLSKNTQNNAHSLVKMFCMGLSRYFHPLVLTSPRVSQSVRWWDHFSFAFLFWRACRVQLCFSYGMYHGRPCIIIKLNNVYGWEPQPYYNLSEVKQQI